MSSDAPNEHYLASSLADAVDQVLAPGDISARIVTTQQDVDEVINAGMQLDFRPYAMPDKMHPRYVRPVVQSRFDSTQSVMLRDQP